MHVLSIIIPCYNEENNLKEIFTQIENVELPNKIKKELIFIDDGSTDKTKSILKELSKHPNVKVLYHKTNKGKGRAIRTGLKAIHGDFVLIQDADLEYDPQDYPKLLAPLLTKSHQVVYGSRELGGRNRAHSGLIFYLGGKFLSVLTNLLYGSKLTDEATCYKIFTKELILSIPLECERFEFCPEITAKVLKRKIHIKEVPIAYRPRSIAEGKKIGKWDGLEAIWTLIKYRFKKTD